MEYKISYGNFIGDYEIGEGSLHWGVSNMWRELHFGLSDRWRKLRSGLSNSCWDLTLRVGWNFIGGLSYTLRVLHWGLSDRWRDLRLGIIK